MMIAVMMIGMMIGMAMRFGIDDKVCCADGRDDSNDDKVCSDDG